MSDLDDFNKGLRKVGGNVSEGYHDAKNAGEAMLEIERLLGTSTPQRVQQVVDMPVEDVVKEAKRLLNDEEFWTKIDMTIPLSRQKFCLLRGINGFERAERKAHEKPSE